MATPKSVRPSCQPSPLPVALSADTLDPLSQRVVYLATIDAAHDASLLPKRSKFIRWLFGSSDAPHPLADPRLEMLRSFCVFVRLGNVQSCQIKDAILAKGHYTLRQLEAARALTLQPEQPTQITAA